MTQPGRAGRASIEIVGDVSKLGRQLERDTQRAIDNTDLDTEHISGQIGDAFANGAREGVDALDDSLPDVKEYFDQVAKYVEDTADSVALDFTDTGVTIRRTFADGRKDSKGFFDGFGDDAKDAGDDIEAKLLRPLDSGFNRLGDVITSAGSALTDLAKTDVSLGGLIKVLAVLAAAPVIIGLSAALADLAGLVTILPGIIGALSASLIVGIVAFNGFGDAIGAVLDGDPEKIAEAMERLAPAARSVVREFQQVVPLFRQVGDSIQQEFFEPLIGQMDRFGKQVLPRLRDELDILAQSMGRAFGHLGDLATDAENVGILERLLASTARITDQLGAAFADLGQAFFNSIDAGLPSLEVLSTRLSDAISGFAEFINTAIADGSFQAFLDDAIATLDELLDLVGAVGELLGVLFSGTDDAGRGFIGTLTDLTQRMTEFFKSAEGQDAIEDFGEMIEAAGIILGFIINVVREVIDIFTDLDDAAIATAGWFKDLGSTIGDAWDTIVGAVSGVIDTVVGFFSALPERIGAFVDSIPGRVNAAFTAMGEAVLTTVVFLIAGIIVFFTDMPGQIIGALAALGSLLADTWDAIVLKVQEAFASAKEFVITTWENILTFFSELGPRSKTFFQAMVDAVIDRVTSLVEYVQGLPGRIISALGDMARLLYNSGANVIQGLIDGIGSRIGALRDKIAAAVQEIRDHLPFSPAKKGPLSGSGSPDRAGAAIGAMIAAGLDAQLPLIMGAAGRAADAAGIPLSPLGEAGVTPLASPLPGQPGTVLSPTSERTDEQLVVLVTIGGEEVYAIIDKRVEAAVNTEVRRLMAGTRGV